MTHAHSTSRGLFRSPLFTAGMLLGCLGLANWTVGALKLSEYEQVAAQTAKPAPDGVRFSSGFTFSDVSESHERHNIAVAKLQYYSVVLASGQLLAFAGLILALAGYLRVRAAGLSAAENKTLLDRP